MNRLFCDAANRDVLGHLLALADVTTFCTIAQLCRSNNGRIAYHCQYHCGEYHGTFMSWSASGELYTRRSYKFGQLCGRYDTFYPGGRQWVSCEYVAGKRHGMYREWYENGSLYKDGHYVADRRHGRLASLHYFADMIQKRWPYEAPWTWQRSRP